jgi:hypothetical protein
MAGPSSVGTEDLFTPIHKAIRSMIYELSARVQTQDFEDLESSRTLVRDLEHNFSAATSAGCLLCLLHHHAGDEERHVFASTATLDGPLTEGFIAEHHGLTRRLGGITGHAHDLLTLGSPTERALAGERLTLELNEFFATYLAHLNREDATLIPFMRAHFTDEQQRRMRGAIMAGIPPDRMAEILRWMLPALNPSELTKFLAGVKATAPPPMFEAIRQLGDRYVPADRWEAVRERVGF